MAAPMPSDAIDHMITSLPRSEQVVVEKLRALVAECLPHVIEKTYPDLRIPFYTRNRLICFIWPPSVLWKSTASIEKQQAKGVGLGFNQGNLMANETGMLLAEGRKQVHIVYFRTLHEINEATVRALLFEAALIDKRFAKKKK
jgi:hypothetical protein